MPSFSAAAPTSTGAVPTPLLLSQQQIKSFKRLPRASGKNGRTAASAISSAKIQATGMFLQRTVHTPVNPNLGVSMPNAGVVGGGGKNA